MLHIIVNPATGSGRGKKIFKRLKPVFDETGVKYQTHYSSRDKSIRDIVWELTTDMGDSDGSTADVAANIEAIRRKSKNRAQYTDIVIIGGDGSMNEAVNGIADFEHTRLGFIPAGSGNDLAKALGVPVVSGPKAVDDIVKSLIFRISKCEAARSIDLGVSETIDSDGQRNAMLFNISSGLGFDAETCYYADRSVLKGLLNKIGLGKLIYIAVALRLILKNEKFRCEIRTADGDTKIYDECLFAVGMNHRYEGGGFMFCPEASDTDGELDFCVVNGVGALKFMRMFPTALSGRHTRFQEIEIFKAKEVYIKTQSVKHIHTDGEADKESSALRLAIADKKLKLLI